MSNKISFLKSLAVDTPFKMIGGVLMHRIGDVTFKLDICTNGYSGHYRILKLTSIDTKEHRTFDTHTFKFDDYLVIAPGSRGHETFEVIDHCGWEWYIKKPTEKSVYQMFGEIEDYCAMMVN